MATSTSTSTFNNPIGLDTFLQGDSRMAQGVNLGNPFEIEKDTIKELNAIAIEHKQKQQEKYDTYKSNLTHGLAQLDESANFTGAIGDELAKKESVLKDYILNHAEMLSAPEKYRDSFAEYQAMLVNYSRDVQKAKGVLAIENQYSQGYKDNTLDHDILRIQENEFKNAKSIEEKLQKVPLPLLNNAFLMTPKQVEQSVANSTIGSYITAKAVTGDKLASNNETLIEIDAQKYYENNKPHFEARSEQARQIWNRSLPPEQQIAQEDYAMQQTIKANPLKFVTEIQLPDGTKRTGTFMYVENKCIRKVIC
jgi:hypothetical protein